MACRAHIQQLWQKTLKHGADGHILGDSVTILEARPGFVRTSFKIKAHHLNGHKSVHGGVMCMLVDNFTWLAMATRGIPSPSSVSTNITCEFVRPAGGLGEELIAESECIQMGKRIGFLRITFYLNGKIVAYGSQQVAMVYNKIKRTFTEDGEKIIELPQEDKARL